MSKLSHRFGNDGAFWISYQDLLRKYQTFDRTRLFDDTWNVTHQWATVRVPWTVDYHDTKFSFTISKPSSVVVVLNQLNTRYFKGMSGQYSFELGFRLHKAGEEDYIVRSRGNYCMSRSVSAEVDLDEAGEYLVLIKVKAERDFTALPVENVIRDNAKDRRDKLLRIGLAYDLAHAKGQLEESKEDKARREKAEARKKAKERQEHKTKLTDEKKQRKRSEKKKQKRQKLAEERAAAKLAKLAAKEERKKMSEENRDLIIVPQGTPIANPPIRILKTQDLANVQEHKNCSECANVDSVSERVVLDTVGSPTEHESSPEGGKAAESVATSTDDLGTPVPTIGPSKTVTFDLPMVSNTPGGFLSSNVSVFGSGTETAQGDSVRADDGLSPSNSTPATRQNSIAALASRSNDITQQIMSSSPDEPQFKEPFGTPPLSKDAKELLEIKRQAIRFLTEEDTDTGSDVSSIPSSAIEESIAAAKRPPPTEPAPAKSDEKKKEEEEDEFEKDPWNAVCVVGLRVYAKALETKKAKDSMNSSSTLEGHLCGSVVGEKHGDEKAADDADEDDGKVILTPTSEDEKELGKMASMSSADIGFEELKQEAEKQNFQAFEKTEKMKSDLVEVTIRVVRPNSWEDGEASLDVDDSAMDATKNLDGKDNRRESVMGARGRLGSTILVKGTDDGKK